MGEGLGQLLLLGIGLWALARRRITAGPVPLPVPRPTPMPVAPPSPVAPASPRGQLGAVIVSQNPWMMQQIAMGAFQGQRKVLQGRGRRTW